MIAVNEEAAPGERKAASNNLDSPNNVQDCGVDVNPSSLYKVAKSLQSQGISCIPVDSRTKQPKVQTWKPYVSDIPTDEELEEWFPDQGESGIAVIAGLVTCLDFDEKHERGIFDRFIAKAAEDGLTGLVDRLILQKTPSGGYHLLWRSNTSIRNLKLATPGGKPEASIETRGQGGYFLIAPSEGYELVHGALTEIPMISEEEQEDLLALARSLHAGTVKDFREPAYIFGNPAELRPGDDYNQRGDLPALLRNHGWTSQNDRNWTRPGKTKGTSATLTEDRQRFWVFSTSTTFETNVYYSPWHVYAILEHAGDWSSAARTLSREGYGSKAGPPQSETDHTIQPAGAIPAEELVTRYPDYRQPVIDGLLREGEVMNAVGDPKVGKSLFVLEMAHSVANGEEWLVWHCSQHNVLIVDNELHDETLAQRLQYVAGSMGVSSKGIYILRKRGSCSELNEIEKEVVEQAKANGCGLIVIDALYRCFSRETNENSNADMTALYNTLDRIAKTSGASVVIVHHSSKGDQSNKSVTDGGSGAGAISRAADTHLFLRSHQTEGCVSVDAVTRSFPQPPPFVIKRNGCWTVEEGLDPTQLKGQEPPNSYPPVEDKRILDCLQDAHAPLSTIMARLEGAGHKISKDKLKGRLAVLVEQEQSFQSTGDRNAICYGLKPETGSTRRKAVEAMLRDHPEYSIRGMAEKAECTERYVRAVRKELNS